MAGGTPPPMPTNHGGRGESEADIPGDEFKVLQDPELANLLMAWYYSGYYTGRYQAQREARESAEGVGTNAGGADANSASSGVDGGAGGSGSVQSRSAS